MNKLELLVFINKAIEHNVNIVLTAERGDITFPIPVLAKHLKMTKENIKESYTEQLVRKDKIFKIVNAELEEEYCAVEIEKKLRELLDYFKIVSNAQTTI